MIEAPKGKYIEAFVPKLWKSNRKCVSKEKK